MEEFIHCSLRNIYHIHGNRFALLWNLFVKSMWYSYQIPCNSHHHLRIKEKWPWGQVVLRLALSSYLTLSPSATLSLSPSVKLSKAIPPLQYTVYPLSNLHIFHFPYFSFAPSYPSYFQTQFQQLNMQQYIHFPIHTFPLHCQTFYFLYLSYFLLSPHHFHLSHYHPLIHFNVQSHNAICNATSHLL